ncbi:hypothetical protein MMC09_003955 [Bachmanniomyces sp. S44760]|nr:hypothetical protein [Bachmanniomyces sp. S44760]
MLEDLLDNLHLTKSPGSRNGARDPPARSPSRLCTLPAEIIVLIAEFLPLSSQGSLIQTCKILREAIGTQVSIKLQDPANSIESYHFLSLLLRDGRTVWACLNCIWLRSLAILANRYLCTCNHGMICMSNGVFKILFYNQVQRWRDTNCRYLTDEQNPNGSSLSRPTTKKTRPGHIPTSPETLAVNIAGVSLRRWIPAALAHRTALNAQGAFQSIDNSLEPKIVDGRVLLKQTASKMIEMRSITAPRSEPLDIWFAYKEQIHAIILGLSCLHSSTGNSTEGWVCPLALAASSLILQAETGSGLYGFTFTSTYRYYRCVFCATEFKLVIRGLGKNHCGFLIESFKDLGSGYDCTQRAWKSHHQVMDSGAGDGDGVGDGLGVGVGGAVDVGVCEGVGVGAEVGVRLYEPDHRHTWSICGAFEQGHVDSSTVRHQTLSPLPMAMLATVSVSASASAAPYVNR